MREKKRIRFELLGAFAYGDGENVKKGQNTMPGKKVLSFLQYLIVNHARNVSSEELIDRFWQQCSSDPANALKNMLFKTRTLLKKMFPDRENLLMTLQGCYGWNPEISIELDSEEFEQACLGAKTASGEEGLEMLSRAVSLYKGDFLSGSDSDWAVPMRRYYQTLYLDACREVLPMLQKQERWTEIVATCEQAQNVDFAADDFVVWQMQALISMGQSGQAVEHYKLYRERLWQEFEISPAEQVEQMYTLADSLCRGIRENEDVLKLVSEGKSEGQAFFCTFDMFQNIVALEKRHLTRAGGGIYAGGGQSGE